MSRFRPRSGSMPVHLAWLLGAVLSSACTDATGDAGGDLEVLMAAAIDASAGSAAAAFDKATEISVRVRAGQQTVLEETQAFDPGDEVHVRVRVARSLAGSVIRVEVALSAPQGPVFEGSGEATLQESGPTTVPLMLAPVISGVALGDPVAAFTALGETRRLTGAAIFVTGDTLAGQGLTWRSLDPDIVAVQPDGVAQAVAEGQARIEATASGVTDSGIAIVHADIALLTVTPATATLSVGEQLIFQATAQDRNGNTLQRTVEWSSSNPSSATIDASGTAVAVGAGTTTITGTADATTGSAILTVRAVPAAPGELTASIVDEAARTYELQWQDRSDDETSFVIERSIDDGEWSEAGQAPAGANRFRGTGLPGENAFRVRACNAEGCSAPSNAASLTFQAGPPVTITLEATDIGVMRGSVQSAGSYLVGFQYGSSADDFGANPAYEQSPLQPATGSAEFEVPVTGGSTGGTTFYRIVASNEFGEAVGDIVNLILPAVDTDGELTYTCRGSDVEARATIDVPAGTTNPIASVAFSFGGTDYYDQYEFPGPTLEDAAASVSTVGELTRYEYRREWSSSEILTSAFADVLVRFTSGASAQAPGIALDEVISGCDSAAPRPARTTRRPGR